MTKKTKHKNKASDKETQKKHGRKSKLASSRTRTIAAFVAIGIVLFLVLGGYKLLRQLYYSYTVKDIHSAEFGKLKGPLSQFGFKDTAPPSPACDYSEIYGEKGTPLLCVTTANTYTEIGKQDTSIAQFTKKAKELDSLLQSNGWQVQSNSAKSFGEWVQAVSLGNDFNTDINATKEAGGARCILIMTVAYSNPKPPAVNTVTSCNAPIYKATGSGAVISE